MLRMFFNHGGKSSDIKNTVRVRQIFYRSVQIVSEHVYHIKAEVTRKIIAAMICHKWFDFSLRSLLKFIARNSATFELDRCVESCSFHGGESVPSTQTHSSGEWSFTRYVMRTRLSYCTSWSLSNGLLWSYTTEEQFIFLLQVFHSSQS